MIYGYIRVSTTNQKIDRQKIVMDEQIGLDEKNIYVDYESGKNFQRKSYQKLIKKLRKGDLLIIKSIDRLGRNYEMIIEEWRKITKYIGADIKVLDMPLLDTSYTEKGLIGGFISDLVLQILSFVAENERNTIRERQREGIKAAKMRGVRFGRPSIELPENFLSIAKKYQNEEITFNEALSTLKMRCGTFYKYLKIYGYERKTNEIYNS
ncbi:MAG: recombinase family protein [Bacilli bacterium]|nr:recombinase family protein [Bacilli bacterium]